MFGGNFAPRGWALCDGQLLSISQNTALFSILGTTYGGDGRTTFGLPDLRSRVPMHPGNGPGLSTRRLGEKSGVESVNLTVNNLPNHSHATTVHIGGDSNLSDAGDGKYLSSEARGGNDALNIYDSVKGSGTMAADAVTSAAVGNNQAFGIVQPYTCVHFIIALQGVFPSRN